MSQSASLSPPVSLLKHISYFVRLGRPLHLAGGFVFNSLGISIAVFLGATVNWMAAFWCQLAITATQLMTHYSNDYFDQDADAVAVTPTRWSSGSRVLPEGLVQPRLALVAAMGSGGIALVAIAMLLKMGRDPLLTLFLWLLAFFLAWNYSGPPLWLNRRGWGELTAALLVPGLTTLLGFQVQRGQIALLPLLAVVPLCCFQFAMLLSVNFPDAAGDVLVNKRTLVVIYGPKRTSTLFLAALTFPYLVLPLLVGLGLPSAVAFVILLTLPIAARQGWHVYQGAATDPARWEGLAFWSITLLMTTALLETAVFGFCCK